MAKQSILNVAFSFKKTALLLSSLFMINLVYATKITWVGSGTNSRWTTVANWNPARLPEPTDSVIVPQGTPRNPVVSIAGTYVAAYLEVQSGKNLTINASRELIVTGDVDVAGTLTNNGTLTVNGTGTIGGSLTSNTSTTTSFNKLKVTNAITNNGAFTVTDSLNIISGTFTNTTGNVSVNTLNLSGTFTNNASLTVNGVGTIGGAITSSGTLTITGNVTVVGILTNSGTFSTIGNINLSGTISNAKTIEIGGNLTGNGRFTHSSTSGSATKLSGSFALDSLNKVTLTRGTFEFAGNNQTLPGVSFYKLTLSGTNSTINKNVTVTNIFTINSGTTLTLLSDTLTLTGTSAVVNGTISGSGILALNRTGTGTANLNLSGSGTISSNVLIQDEVRIVTGSTINLGKFTVSSGQRFTNNNVLIYSPADAPTIHGSLAGNGMIVIGTGGVTHATVGDKGRFELTGSPTSIITSTSFAKLYEYGATTTTSTSGNPTGSRFKTFTIAATAPARLANGNARVAAGGRGFSLGSSPVPVTFVAFDGVMQGNTALISWATSMEFNNKEFIVEASADAVNFTQVASVNGVGTTNSLSNYSVTVTNTLKYYRLKQVDFDGVSTYSKIIEVSGENINEFSVFPNPFVGNDLYLNYNGSTEVDGVIVKIYDLNEKVHFEASLNFFGNEVSKLQLTEKLNKGIYFVSIQSQTGVKIQKLLVE